eukprot:Pgem_evm1s8726
MSNPWYTAELPNLLYYVQTYLNQKISLIHKELERSLDEKQLDFTRQYQIWLQRQQQHSHSQQQNHHHHHHQYQQYQQHHQQLDHFQQHLKEQHDRDCFLINKNFDCLSQMNKWLTAVCNSAPDQYSGRSLSHQNGETLQRFLVKLIDTCLNSAGTTRESVKIHGFYIRNQLVFSSVATVSNN